MAWDFETDPEFQKKLDWIEDFMREEVEPLSQLGLAVRGTLGREKFIKPLQEKVKAQGLWACHLGPELGGQGFGQLKLGLMNEKLGRNSLAPTIFGCQAPDTGNAEIIAHYGTDKQKEQYLWPLLNGDIRSAFSMSEPTGGSDPLTFKTRAVLDGNEWVINGEKWFSTNARYSKVLVLYAVTDPDAKDPYRRTSIFLVPTDTPGVEIIRNVGVGSGEIGNGTEGYVRYTDVRVPYDALLGERGAAFVIAQVRLGGGRVHHAMRTVGACKHALDLMCRRAVSRTTRDGKLADLQMVQEQIADSWIAVEQFRLLVLRTAWLIDKHKDYNMVRKDIAAIKVAMPKVYNDVATKAAHLHGALGVSNEMPFMHMVTSSLVMGIADGPTEVHKVTLAKQVLKDYRPDNDLFPNYHIPRLKEAAEEKYAKELTELKEAYRAERAKNAENA
ncbi:acyl-CoA dehydrogenase [Phenylobacterium sp. Root77]|jgi:acyl-CoA dehydrogenase|uniref:acyl-CoA dehydrogenase family protein n=1 Tax=unclassified Phenylobacterium TaxID=2640670 RepID=UPI0006F3782F|nr:MULTISPECIES: acyl-CoA dehydrogenase family protein [unclassified Phenylobacterium]KQW70949.1 acyl-CoA dehydrogenase [Phenylobacterium sp. Root1277]KQW95893.1 acyl-CoA dehydrogenase [Phenylobacterium sp. Root1290]KRC41678.1 acyl-CoA dehydrogenase [Phenylobacterium sp. Root77]